MPRNLAYQFKNAIDQSFSGGGFDKHSLKNDGAKPGDHVYSYSERENLIKTSHQVGDFIKENYSNVKYVKDIKSEMIQEFLNSKSYACSNSTLGQYRSRINTLQTVINNIYHVKSDFTKDLITPVAVSKTEKLRNIAMDTQDLQKILQRAKNMDSKSQASIAIEFAGRFGLRVSECCKLRTIDINLDKMELSIIGSKGGRSRVIPIKSRDVEFLKKIITGKGKWDRICKIKEDSVNKYLVRAEEALGIRGKYRQACTGIHCIRKMVAQRIFDEFRAKDFSRKDALNETSQYLGHGKNRDELMKEYVLNIH